MTMMKQRKPMQRTPWKQGPKTERQRLIAQADKLASQCALKRDEHTCQRCGKEATDVHHIVHRNHFALRWKLVNLISLCRECHSMDGEGEGKGILRRYIEKWLKKRAKLKYDDLVFFGNNAEPDRPEDAIARLTEWRGK